MNRFRDTLHLLFLAAAAAGLLMVLGAIVSCATPRCTVNDALTEGCRP